MPELTDILSLGTDYNVVDLTGAVKKTIKIIPHGEILDAAKGKFLYEDTCSEYIEKSISLLTGFDKIDINRVLWHATHDDEIALLDIIDYAFGHGYNIVIIEHLEETEDLK